MLKVHLGRPVTVPYYGLGNEEANKRKDVVYKVSIGNVVWMGLGFVGLLDCLYEPVREKIQGENN